MIHACSSRDLVVGRRHFSDMCLQLAHITFIFFLLVALVPTVYAQAGHSDQSLKGAWNTTIVFDGPIPTCSAPAINTRDGGVISNACALNESPGYGQWVRTGNHEFAITFVGLEYDLDGTMTGTLGASSGTYKVRARVHLSDNSNEFNGPFTTDIFDLNGNVIFTVSGTVTGKRIVVEPL
jgi:hypothetical protein